MVGLMRSGGQNLSGFCVAFRPTSSSQSPLYSGRPSMGIRHGAPLLLLSPPNPLRWASAGTPCVLPHLAWCLPTRLAGWRSGGPVSHRPGITAQLPWFCPGRRSRLEPEHHPNLNGTRAQWPGKKRKDHSDFARRMRVPRSQEGVPRKWGPGQAAYERPLREGARRRRPRRFFGDFLIAQKVTPSFRSLGRNLYKKPPPQDSSYGGGCCMKKRITPHSPRPQTGPRPGCAAQTGRGGSGSSRRFHREFRPCRRQ